MARVNNLSNFLTDVASAIKTKKGSETAIPAANFDTEILALPSQGTYQTKTVNITTNGTTTVTPDVNYDAISSLDIVVNVPATPLQSKSVQITSNGSITVLPDTGYDGFTQVGLNVNVPTQAINNQNKTITSNGEYTADQGYTGIGTATVNVPITNTSEYNGDLLLTQQILGSTLPYIQLKYIESTGTEYIDSGVYDSNGVSVNSRLMFIHPEDTWNFPIGAQETVNAKVDGCNVPITACRRQGQSITYFTFYTDTNVTQTNMIVHNDALYDIYASTLINNSYMNINDTIITDTSRSNIGTKNMYIFALNDGGSPGFFSSLKLYYLQIYNSKNVLMRDFIPVKRRSDNEVCLYDKVSGQFFTNQGTGTFVAGPVIN